MGESHLPYAYQHQPLESLELDAYVLVDDTGLLCDSYHTTELGTHDHTIVSIMD